MPNICPLCQSTEISRFHTDKTREYWQCKECHLVFVPEEFHLSLAAQKIRYDLHQNDPRDPGYRAFLENLIEPLAARLKPNSAGLDFGAGPTAALAQLLAARGFQMVSFDPIYLNRREALNAQYDFVTCCETAEHFTRPHEDWHCLFRLVRKHGWLGVMTALLGAEADFPQWHYRTDPTHVCFYSLQTMVWLARRYRAALHVISPRVVLFQQTIAPVK